MTIRLYGADEFREVQNEMAHDVASLQVSKAQAEAMTRPLAV